MRSNQPPQCEDLPVVVSDPDIEKQVSPLTVLPNGVVSKPPKATATRHVLTLCLPYLILFLCVVVLWIIAVHVYISVLLIYIICGVLVVIGIGIALRSNLTCFHAAGVVERANKNAKNIVPPGNHPGL